MMQKIKENIIIVVVIVLGIALIVGGIIYSKRTKPIDVQTFMKDRDLKNCEISLQRVVVEGSGNDVYPAGTELEVEMNYYNCNVGKRDEVAMIVSPGRENPIFKYIKMVPGDKFEVVKKGASFYRVEVNGDDLETPDGKTYEFTDRKSRMIALYESNYKDGIRDGAYFVFGTTVGGGFDSTRFGPVTNERMVGRVVKVLRSPSGQNEAVPAPAVQESSAVAPVAPAAPAAKVAEPAVAKPAPVKPVASKPVAKKQATPKAKPVAKPPAKPAEKQ